MPNWFMSRQNYAGNGMAVYSMSPEEDKSVINCLFRHEEEYIARHMTYLQHVIWTRDIWVSLDVKGFQEVQNYSGALLQTDGVVTLAHGWVGPRVARTGQDPRWRGQQLAVARHCGEDSHTDWNPTWTFWGIVVSSRRPEYVEENDDEDGTSRDSALNKNIKFILKNTGQKQTPRTTGDFQEPN